MLRSHVFFNTIFWSGRRVTTMEHWVGLTLVRMANF